LVAIVFLGMLLFNWLGYRLIVDFLERSLNTQLEARLDMQEYNESELISLKAPLHHLAYFNGSINFVRVDGQITFNGTLYNYVKQRLYHDSVELLCIPNLPLAQLQNAKLEFFKITNGLQSQDHRQKGHSNPALKNHPVEFYSFPMDLDNFLVFLLIRRPIPTPLKMDHPFLKEQERPPLGC